MKDGRAGHSGLTERPILNDSFRYCLTVRLRFAHAIADATHGIKKTLMRAPLMPAPDARSSVFITRAREKSKSMEMNERTICRAGQGT
jgi:hypothetical protein